MSSSLSPLYEWKLGGIPRISNAQTFRHLAFGGPSTITFWQQDGMQWTCVSTLELPLPFSLFALSPDGRKCAVVVSEPDEVIRVYLVRDLTLTAKFPTVRGTTTALAWLPRGDIVSGNDEGWVYVWDFARAFEPYAFQLAYKANLETTEGQSIQTIVCSPDGTSLAIGAHNDPLVRLRNLARDVHLAISTPSGGSRTIHSVAWSSDSQHLALSRSERVEIWTRRYRKTPVASFAPPLGHTLTTLAWRTPGSHLLAANLHGEICQWEVATGRRAELQADACIFVALSAEGQVLMGRHNGLVHLYAPFEVNTASEQVLPGRARRRKKLDEKAR